MSDHFISSKGQFGLRDNSTLHVATSSTSADTLEIRITDGVTGMTRQRIIEFLRQIERVIIQGSLHSTKFPYL